MLANKKVYVGKHSREIQEKAFELGCEWSSGRAGIQYLDAPFLYFGNKFITYGDDVIRFNANKNEEITAEEILAMEVPKPKKSCKELGEVNGYYINEDGEILNFREWNPNFDISDFDDGRHFDILPTKEEAEAYKILPFLLQWRDKYNKGWKPDWIVNIYKYNITVIGGELSTSYSQRCSSLFAFKTPEIRNKFLEDFKEELEIVKHLL